MRNDDIILDDARCSEKDDIRTARAVEFSRFASNLPCGICQVASDDDLTILYANNSFYQTFDYTPEDIASCGIRSMRDLYDEQSFQKGYAKARRLIETGIDEFEIEGRVFAKNGHPRHCLFRLKYFRDTEEISAAVIDITRRFDAERRLQVAEEEYRIACEQSDHDVYRYDVVSKELCYHGKNATPFIPVTDGNAVQEAPEGIIATGCIAKRNITAFRNMFASIDSGSPSGHIVMRVNSNNASSILVRCDYTTIFIDEATPRFAILSCFSIGEQQERELIYQVWRRSTDAKALENCMYYEFNLTSGVCEREDGSAAPRILPLVPATYEGVTGYLRLHGVIASDRRRLSHFLSRDRLLTAYKNGVFSDKIQYRGSLKNHERCWIEATVQMAEYPYTNDVKLFLKLENIDMLKTGELNLRSQSQTDPLTGLLNRNAFEEAVEAYLKSKVITKTCAFAIIDIDYFKRFNDTLGHDVGDQVLRDVAASLKSLLRKGDIVGRLGGDEFTLFLPHIPNQDIIASRADLICKMIEKPYGDLTASCTIGISMSPKDGLSFAELYKKADIALYKGKNLGRKQYTFYTEEMHEDNWGSKSTPIDTVNLINDTVEDDLRRRSDNLKRLNAEFIRRQDENERYRIILEGSSTVIVEWNFLTDEFYCSADYADYAISQYDYADFFDKGPALNAVHPEDRFLIERLLEEDNVNLKHRAAEALRLQRLDGTYQWVHFECINLYDASGELERTIFVFDEINLTLEERRIQLDAIVNYICGGILIFEVEGSTGAFKETHYVSPSFFVAFNRDANTQPARDINLALLVHPDDLTSLKSSMKQCSLSGKPVDHSYRVQYDDGTVEWRTMRAIRIPYQDADNPVLLAIVTDTTSLKQSERELQLTRDLMHMAIDLSALGSFVFDVASNMTIHSVPRIKAEDTIVEDGAEGIVARGIVHEDSAPALKRLYGEMRRGIARSSAIVKVRREHNRYRFARISYQTIFDEEDKPYKCVAISEELSPQASAKLIFDQESKMESTSFVKREDAIFSFSADLLHGDIMHSWERGCEALDTGIHRYKNYDHLIAALLNRIPDAIQRRDLANKISVSALQSAYVKEGIILRSEFIRLEHDDTPGWASLAIRLLTSPYSGALCVFATLRDIDAKKKRELKYGIVPTDENSMGIYDIESFVTLSEGIMRDSVNLQTIAGMASIRIVGYSAALESQGSFAMDAYKVSFERLITMNLRSSSVIGRGDDDLILAFFNDIVSFSDIENRINTVIDEISNPDYFQTSVNQLVTYETKIALQKKSGQSLQELIATVSTAS